MGSFTRVQVFYTNLPEFLKNWKLPLYGADLEGENVHKHNFEDQLGLIIGSESHGISKDIIGFINQKLTIPRLGQAESLNAAMATGIILDNIFRTT